MRTFADYISFQLGLLLMTLAIKEPTTGSVTRSTLSRSVRRRRQSPAYRQSCEPILYAQFGILLTIRVDVLALTQYAV